MRGMTGRRIFPLLMLVSIFAAPLTAQAKSRQEDIAPEDRRDARLEGFDKPVGLKDPGSSAGSYFILALAGGLSVAVLFKNVKRSHLD